MNAFDFAIFSEDRFTGAYIEKAKLLKEMGRLNEAIEHFQIALQLDDPSTFIYVNIAICHAELGNDQLALQFYKKGINEDPANEKAWTGIIDFYLQRQDLKKALYYCNKALQINQNYISYWKRSALLNKELKQYAEADMAFKNTIELGNYELDIWTAWLDTLIFLNEWEKIAKIGQQAKEFYPDDISIDFRLAGAAFKLGKTIEMDYFLQNIRLHKDPLPDALNELFPRMVKLL